MQRYRNFIILSLVAFMINSAHGDDSEQIPVQCMTECVSPYGAVLGVSKRGVEAYSNCSADCVVYDPHHWHGTYTGIKWQCVEYARRWLLQNKGVVYGDVDIAADIWDKIDHLVDVETKQKLPLEAHLNGAQQPPEPGDLLIYAKAFNDTGHVAVVIEADYDAGYIKVAEQNYRNLPWADDYSRKIELIKRADTYWLLDSYLLGWKHLPAG